MSRTRQSTARLDVTLTHPSKPPVRFKVASLVRPDTLRILNARLEPHSRTLTTVTFDVIINWAAQYCPQATQELGAQLAKCNNQGFTFNFSISRK